MFYQFCNVVKKKHFLYAIQFGTSRFKFSSWFNKMQELIFQDNTRVVQSTTVIFILIGNWLGIFNKAEDKLHILSKHRFF